MAIAADSTAAFRALVKELNLDAIWPKLDENGWTTFVNFAFSTPDSTSKDVEGFEKSVLPALLDIAKPEEKRMVPLVRRLFAQSYAYANALLASEVTSAGTDQKVHLTPADRIDRLAKFR